MTFLRKFFFMTLLGAVAFSSLLYVDIKLKDEKSILFQLREIFFPTEYSRGQMRNFEADISYVGKQWKYHDSGKRFFEAGEYEKSIEEYKKAIELAQNDPRGSLLGIENQKFPRGALIEVYEKAERYSDAIDQIDWLLAHKPSESYALTLLARKEVVTAESAGQYKKALDVINQFLKSAEQLNRDRINEYQKTKTIKGWIHPELVFKEFRSKREDILRKFMAEKGAVLS